MGYVLPVSFSQMATGARLVEGYHFDYLALAFTKMAALLNQQAACLRS